VRLVASGAVCALVVIAGALALRDETKSTRLVATPSLEPVEVSPTSLRVTRDASRLVPAPAPLSGSVHDDDGVPLPNANVCALVEGDQCCENSRCVTTDRQGRFTLPGPELPLTRLLTSALGYLSVRTDAHAAERAAPLRITLPRGGAELRGSVFDATGGVVIGALVTGRTNAGMTAVAVSDAAGHFALSAPSGEEVELLAQAESYSQAAGRARSPATGIALVLAPAAVIPGTIVDDVTGEPVAFAAITARPQGDVGGREVSLAARSDVGGQFRLRGLQGGHYEIVASGESFRTQKEWVAVAAGQVSAPVVLRARAATTLSGVVVLGDTPCQAAEVEVSGPHGVFTQSGADGAVRFEGLLPGPYEIIAGCAQAVSRRETLTLGTEPISRTWSLKPGLAVTGSVESAAGIRVENVSVSARPTDDAQSAVTCASDARGEFSCGGLTAGEYDFSVVGSGPPASETVRVNVSEHLAPRVQLRLQASGTIRVAVESGDAVVAAPIRVFARGADLFAIEALPNGAEFVLERLPLGAYELYVERPTPDPVPTRVALEFDAQVLSVRLSPPAHSAISGRVLDEHGVPLVDAWVWASPSETSAALAVRTPPALTDEAGGFWLPGLASGAYDLHVRHGAVLGELTGVNAGASGIAVRVSTAGPDTEL
jgi:protocatechuate 3,4-dioxygenase beta subunit